MLYVAEKETEEKNIVKILEKPTVAIKKAKNNNIVI